jgi:opacity protein-like surface antigen
VTRASSPVAMLALMLVLPAALHAQSASTRDSPIAIRGFGDAGVTVFSATQSFKTILGRPSGPVFGGGVELDLAKHLFVSVGASRFRRTSHRVFVFNGQVFNLDDPATITVTPLEVNAGFRLTRRAGIVPYGGGGVGWYKYQETSPHSDAADNVNSTSTGYQVLGGAEIPFGKWFAAAAEAQFASVPKALGHDSTGVSSLYNEHNLGGVTFRVKVVIGR